MAKWVRVLVTMDCASHTLARHCAHRTAIDGHVHPRSRGPGCSSIGGGFLSELGPFYPTPDAGKLVGSQRALVTETA